MEREHGSLSVVRQCALVGVSRSGLYRRRTEVSEEDEELMGRMDRQYLMTPYYGSRRMTVWLRSLGKRVNRKRVRRLMRAMGLQAVYRRPNTSRPAKGHKVYPYLLGGVTASGPDHVWSTDITYIPMARGHLYLVAIIDWYSRYVLSWRLSNTMDVEFCMEAMRDALRIGTPRVFNTDQGSQFTSRAFTGLLEANGIAVSMDGKGRCVDNVLIERLWRTVKYEEVYLRAYESGSQARAGLGAYFDFYNTSRPHQALGYRTPAEVYANRGEEPARPEVTTAAAGRLTAAGLQLNLVPDLS